MSCSKDENSHSFFSSFKVLGEGDELARLIEYFNYFCYENYHETPVFALL